MRALRPVRRIRRPQRQTGRDRQRRRRRRDPRVRRERVPLSPDRAGRTLRRRERLGHRHLLAEVVRPQHAAHPRAAPGAHRLPAHTKPAPNVGGSERSLTPGGAGDRPLVSRRSRHPDAWSRRRPRERSSRVCGSAPCSSCPASSPTRVSRYQRPRAAAASRPRGVRLRYSKPRDLPLRARWWTAHGRGVVRTSRHRDCLAQRVG